MKHESVLAVSRGVTMKLTLNIMMDGSSIIDLTLIIPENSIFLLSYELVGGIHNYI
jgi:hypothetical protein